MNISESLQNAINDQINLELTSMYAYYAMAAWFETTPYTGFAAWMKKQSQEEQEHADKFFAYVNERGGTVKLKAIPEPKASFEKPIEAFKASLAHEQAVTKSIYGIYKMAQDEGDYATLEFLNWFLSEQVEEEATVQDMIDKLELSQDNAGALMRLDYFSGKRES